MNVGRVGVPWPADEDGVVVPPVWYLEDEADGPAVDLDGEGGSLPGTDDGGSTGVNELGMRGRLPGVGLDERGSGNLSVDNDTAVRPLASVLSVPSARLFLPNQLHPPPRLDDEPTTSPSAIMSSTSAGACSLRSSLSLRLNRLGDRLEIELVVMLENVDVVRLIRETNPSLSGLYVDDAVVLIGALEMRCRSEAAGDWVELEDAGARSTCVAESETVGVVGLIRRGNARLDGVFPRADRGEAILGSRYLPLEDDPLTPRLTRL